MNRSAPARLQALPAAPLGVWFELEVEDLSGFLQAFAEECPVRALAGITGHGLDLLSAGGAHRLLVYLAYEQPAGLARYLERSQVLRRSDVRREPELWYLRHEQDAPSGAPSSASDSAPGSASERAGELPRRAAVVRQEVEDYDKWFAVFQELGPLRASYGVRAVRVSTDPASRKTVYLYALFDDEQRYAALLQDEHLRARLAAGGLIGPPTARRVIRLEAVTY